MVLDRQIAIALAGLTLALTPAWGPAARQKATPVSAESRERALDLMAQAAAAETAGKPLEALGLYRASVAQAPSPAGWYNVGRLLADSKRKAEAIAAFDAALVLSPKYESARVARERLEKRHGLGSVDLIALDREAETAHSLAESLPAAQPLVLAQESTRPSRARTGVSIPPPPAVPDATPSVPSPRSTPDSQSPAARSRDDFNRSAILENKSRPVIQERGGFLKVLGGPLRRSSSTSPSPVSMPESRSSVPESAPVPRRPAVSVDIQPSEPAELVPDQGGSARVVTPSGGKSPGLLSRIGLGPKNPPVPLPGSRVFQGHGVAEINAAAFSSEAGKRPASIGYGQPTGTAAIGTFAFHRDRGDSYRILERWNDARMEYDYALRQAPGDAETRAMLGEMQARIGDERRALRNLAQAGRDAPALSAVPYRKGNALRALKRNELAIGSYLDAIRLDGTNRDALNNLGVTFMETGSYDRAAQTFERLLGLDPNHANAILNLGILNEEHLGDSRKAANYYNRYLALQGDIPRKTEVRRWLTLLERKTSQP